MTGTGLNIRKHPASFIGRFPFGRTGLILLLLLMISTEVPAENYLLNGGQESRIDYQMVQKVLPSAGDHGSLI